MKLPKGYWVGFDCQHTFSVDMTKEVVIKETKKLAKQLKIKNLILRGLEDEKNRYY